MIKSNKKQKLVRKRTDEQHFKFRAAYERFAFSHRQMAKKEFCRIHQITEASFNQKLSAYSKVSVMEVEWMERYDPYKIAEPATV